MKIIDSHLHFWPSSPYFDEIAKNSGDLNTEAHLRGLYSSLGISGGIVMGNRGIDLKEHQYPEYLRYCIGIEGNSSASLSEEKISDLAEQHLKRKECVGIKLYPGYSPIYVTDPRLEPLYALAAKYHKPVAVHMGLTAGSNALLKYSHPLTLDEAAVLHPQVQFVMCHFGNPWLMDAAAVLEKNENVAADLSGLLVGRVTTQKLIETQNGYLEALKTWTAYIENYDKFMFGTDWPLANYSDYIAFTQMIIPEQHWDKVFYGNAERIYLSGDASAAFLPV